MSPARKLALVEFGKLRGGALTPCYLRPGVGVAKAHLRYVFNDMPFVTVGKVRCLGLHDALSYSAI